MEILESIGWITLGFAPVFVSMELAWRLSKKYDVSKPKANEEPGLIKVREAQLRNGNPFYNFTLSR